MHVRTGEIPTPYYAKCARAVHLLLGAHTVRSPKIRENMLTEDA